ncbi:MAG TPA: peptide ABC transporter substrate-binding protein [Acidimicrobiales bacterium]|nr:peptide ABC transporter substrate-binding protein [Acidimicrobiales bacterium]
MADLEKFDKDNKAPKTPKMLPDMTRRQFMMAGGAGALGLYVAGHGGLLRRDPMRSAAMARADVAKRAFGMAPAADQFLVAYNNPTGLTYAALDFYQTVYSRAPLADNFETSLVRIDPNYGIVPGTAKSWAQTSATTWAFHIMPGIMWSDGNELTANDYVETFRYSADPKHAWDFSWYWSGVIKNYTEAVAGKAPVNSIGVSVGADKYTFVVTTEGPIAFIPNAMLYSMPLSAAGLAKYGNGLYNINPATAISCGPYILKTFDPTAEVVLVPNTKYTAPYKPAVQYLVSKISTADYLSLLDTGAVDFNATQALSKTDLAAAKTFPKLSKLTPAINPQDFRVYYVFFKTKAAPFNNLKVRQAFAHSADRKSIIGALLPGLAIPAYGYLMDGYPFAVSTPLEKYTNYDPELAQKLLAEAGYPKGKGFPSVTFSYPASTGAIDSLTTGSVVQALSAGWNSVLFGGSSTLLLEELETSTFYSKMEKQPETEIEMGFVSYGMDYFDASNMLSVYKAGGRHDWDNAKYDNLLAQGAAEFNKAKRQEIYTEAQVLQTSQAPAVFVFHGLDAYLTWPYMQGPALAKNYLGYDGLQWPGFFPFSTYQEGIYIGNDVGSYPRQNERGLL